MSCHSRQVSTSLSARGGGLTVCGGSTIQRDAATASGSISRVVTTVGGHVGAVVTFSLFVSPLPTASHIRDSLTSQRPGKVDATLAKPYANSNCGCLILSAWDTSIGFCRHRFQVAVEFDFINGALRVVVDGWTETLKPELGT